MIITCPSCQTRYKVEPVQFGPKGRRVRCTGCAHVWTEEPARDLPKVLPPVVPLDQEPDLGTTEDPPSVIEDQAEAPAPASAETGAPPAGQQRRGAVGWVVLAAIVAVIVIGGILGKNTVIRTWPAAERLYLAVGLETRSPGKGLLIKVTNHSRAVALGRKLFIVKGQVTNVSDKERMVPKLQVLLRGSDAGALASWQFSPARIRLQPGETSAFETRYQDPPAGATGFVVDFVAAGK
jgi:predicted Zn finger-like uncharacterized protein